MQTLFSSVASGLCPCGCDQPSRVRSLAELEGRTSVQLHRDAQAILPSSVSVLSGYSTIGREHEFAALFNRPDLSEFDPFLWVETRLEVQIAFGNVPRDVFWPVPFPEIRRDLFQISALCAVIPNSIDSEVDR